MEHIAKTKNPDRILAALLLGLAALALIATLWSGKPYVTSLDSAVVSALYRIRTAWPWLTFLFLVITDLGSDLFLFSLAVVLALWCVRRGWRADAVWLAGTAVFARILGLTAKLLSHSPRPDIVDAPPVHHFSGFGFPSGHALMSMAVYGSIVLFILRHAGSRNSRMATILAGALLIGAIGFSRIFLGAHWTNDVVGGFLYGACLLTLLEIMRLRFLRS